MFAQSETLRWYDPELLFPDCPLGEECTSHRPSLYAVQTTTANAPAGANHHHHHHFIHNRDAKYSIHIDCEDESGEQQRLQERVRLAVLNELQHRTLTTCGSNSKSTWEMAKQLAAGTKEREDSGDANHDDDGGPAEGRRHAIGGEEEEAGERLPFMRGRAAPSPLLFPAPPALAGSSRSAATKPNITTASSGSGTSPAHGTSQHLRELFSDLGPGATSSTSSTGTFGPAGVTEVTPVLCPVSAAQHAYTHVASAHDVFAVVTAQTPQQLILFDQFNNIPVSSIALGGSVFLSSSGSDGDEHGKNRKGRDSSVFSLSLSSRNSVESCGSGVLNGNMSFFSAAAAGLYGEGRLTVPCAVAQQEPVVSLFMCPRGDYCIIVFASGKAAFVYIPQASRTSFSDDDGEDDENTNGEAGASHSARARDSKTGRDGQGHKWRKHARRWLHVGGSRKSRAGEEVKDTTGNSDDNHSEAAAAAALKPRVFSLVFAPSVISGASPGQAPIRGGVGAPAASTASTPFVIESVGWPSDADKTGGFSGEVLLGSRRGGMLLVCELSPTGVVAARVVNRLPPSISQFPIAAVAYTTTFTCPRETTPEAGSGVAPSSKGKTSVEAGQRLPSYPHTSHYRHVDDGARDEEEEGSETLDGVDEEWGYPLALERRGTVPVAHAKGRQQQQQQRQEGKAKATMEKDEDPNNNNNNNNNNINNQPYKSGQASLARRVFVLVAISNRLYVYASASPPGSCATLAEVFHSYKPSFVRPGTGAAGDSRMMTTTATTVSSHHHHYDTMASETQAEELTNYIAIDPQVLTKTTSHVCSSASATPHAVTAMSAAAAAAAQQNAKACLHVVTSSDLLRDTDDDDGITGGASPLRGLDAMPKDDRKKEEGQGAAVTSRELPSVFFWQCGGIVVQGVLLHGTLDVFGKLRTLRAARNTAQDPWGGSSDGDCYGLLHDIIHPLECAARPFTSTSVRSPGAAHAPRQSSMRGLGDASTADIANGGQLRGEDFLLPIGILCVADLTAQMCDLGQLLTGSSTTSNVASAATTRAQKPAGASSRYFSPHWRHSSAAPALAGHVETKEATHAGMDARLARGDVDDELLDQFSTFLSAVTAVNRKAYHHQQQQLRTQSGAGKKEKVATYAAAMAMKRCSSVLQRSPGKAEKSPSRAQDRNRATGVGDKASMKIHRSVSAVANTPAHQHSRGAVRTKRESLEPLVRPAQTTVITPSSLPHLAVTEKLISLAFNYAHSVITTTHAVYVFSHVAAMPLPGTAQAWRNCLVHRTVLPRPGPSAEGTGATAAFSFYKASRDAHCPHMFNLFSACDIVQLETATPAASYAARLQLVAGLLDTVVALGKDDESKQRGPSHQGRGRTSRGSEADKYHAHNYYGAVHGDAQRSHFLVSGDSSSGDVDESEVEVRGSEAAAAGGGGGNPLNCGASSPVLGSPKLLRSSTAVVIGGSHMPHSASGGSNSTANSNSRRRRQCSSIHEHQQPGSFSLGSTHRQLSSALSRTGSHPLLPTPAESNAINEDFGSTTKHIGVFTTRQERGRAVLPSSSSRVPPFSFYNRGQRNYQQQNQRQRSAREEHVATETVDENDKSRSFNGANASPFSFVEGSSMATGIPTSGKALAHPQRLVRFLQANPLLRELLLVLAVRGNVALPAGLGLPHAYPAGAVAALCVPGIGVVPGVISLHERHPDTNMTCTSFKDCLRYDRYYTPDAIYEMALRVVLSLPKPPLSPSFSSSPFYRSGAAGGGGGGADATVGAAAAAAAGLLGKVRHAYGTYLLRHHRYLEAAAQFARPGPTPLSTLIIEFTRSAREENTTRPLILLLLLRLRYLEYIRNDGVSAGAAVTESATATADGGRQLEGRALAVQLILLLLELTSAQEAEESAKMKAQTQTAAAAEPAEEERCLNGIFKTPNMTNIFSPHVLSTTAPLHDDISPYIQQQHTSLQRHYSRMEMVMWRYSLRNPRALLEDAMLRYTKTSFAGTAGSVASLISVNYAQLPGLSRAVEGVSSPRLATWAAAMMGSPADVCALLLLRERRIEEGLACLDGVCSATYPLSVYTAVAVASGNQTSTRTPDDDDDDAAGLLDDDDNCSNSSSWEGGGDALGGGNDGARPLALLSCCHDAQLRDRLCWVLSSAITVNEQARLVEKYGSLLLLHAAAASPCATDFVSLVLLSSAAHLPVRACALLPALLLLVLRPYHEAAAATEHRGTHVMGGSISTILGGDDTLDGEEVGAMEGTDETKSAGLACAVKASLLHAQHLSADSQMHPLDAAPTTTISAAVRSHAVAGGGGSGSSSGFHKDAVIAYFKHLLSIGSHGGRCAETWVYNAFFFLIARYGTDTQVSNGMEMLAGKMHGVTGWPTRQSFQCAGIHDEHHNREDTNIYAMDNMTRMNDPDKVSSGDGEPAREDEEEQYVPFTTALRACAAWQRWMGCAWVLRLLGFYLAAVKMVLKYGEELEKKSTAGAPRFMLGDVPPSPLVPSLSSSSSVCMPVALAESFMRRTGIGSGTISSGANLTEDKESDEYFPVTVYEWEARNNSSGGTDYAKLSQQRGLWLHLIHYQLLYPREQQQQECDVEQRVQGVLYLMRASHGVVDMGMVLQLLPDTVHIEDLKLAMLRIMRRTRAAIDTARAVDSAAGKGMSALQQQYFFLRGQPVIGGSSPPLPGTTRCSVCARPVLEKPFIVFPRCGHAVHLDCYRHRIKQQKDYPVTLRSERDREDVKANNNNNNNNIDVTESKEERQALLPRIASPGMSCVVCSRTALMYTLSEAPLCELTADIDSPSESESVV